MASRCLRSSSLLETIAEFRNGCLGDRVGLQTAKATLAYRREALVGWVSDWPDSFEPEA